MKLELGCCGLEHKDGGYFATLVDSETHKSIPTILKADTWQELVEVAKALNIPNWEFAEKRFNLQKDLTSKQGYCILPA